MIKLDKSDYQRMLIALSIEVNRLKCIFYSKK